MIRGNIELATHLHLIPNYNWDNTRKIRRGLPRLRIVEDEMPDICKENENICPVKVLNKFTKHKNKRCAVDGCERINSNAFKIVEQKMVDTLIACDIISFSKEKNVKSLYVLTEDCDVLPALAIGGISLPNKINLFVQNLRTVENYALELSTFGVEISNWNN